MKEGNCYTEFDWIEEYLNRTSTKKALGIDPSISFVLISNDVHEAFSKSGDMIRNSAPLLPELVNDGIRLLVYAGMAGTRYLLLSDVLAVLTGCLHPDMACNYIVSYAT